jgi:hypothetical protein
VNPILDRVFRGKDDKQLDEMVKGGRDGLLGFCKFSRYFVGVRGLDVGLFEARGERLQEAILRR